MSEGLTKATTENVIALLAPLFVLFDFFEVDRSIYEGIVANFKNGKII